MKFSQEEVSLLLHRWGHGDGQAFERLFPLIYDELKALASRQMRGERPGHTLQTTALVHEAYFRLVNQRVNWSGRAHFLGIAAQAMRRVLVDHARRLLAGKRIAPGDRFPLDEAPEVGVEPSIDLVGLDEALSRLAELDPEQAQLVELRFFGGLTIMETAKVLKISPATVSREWRLAKLWLRRELRRGQREEKPKGA